MLILSEILDRIHLRRSVGVTPAALLPQGSSQQLAETQQDPPRPAAANKFPRRARISREFRLTCQAKMVTLYYNVYNRFIMSTAISVRLPEPLARQLTGVAKETERSRAYNVQKALEIYMAEHADLQIAADRLHDHTDAVISSKTLRSTLGL